MAHTDNGICDAIETAIEGLSRFAAVESGLTMAFFEEENYSFPAVFVRWVGAGEFEDPGVPDGEVGHYCFTEIVVKRLDAGANPAVMKRLRADLVEDKDLILDALEADPSLGGLCFDNWGRGTAVEEIEAEQVADQAYLVIRLRHEYRRAEGATR